MYLLITGLLLIITSICIGSLLWAFSLFRKIRSFLSPGENNSRSQFAEVIDAIGYSLGHSAAVELKTTLMGVKSGMSKAIEADVLDQAGAILEQKNPYAGAFFNGLGAKSKKSMLNHPLAQLILNQILSGASPKSNVAKPESVDNQTRFKL